MQVFICNLWHLGKHQKDLYILSPLFFLKVFIIHHCCHGFIRSLQKWAEELSWLHCRDLTSTAVLRKLPLTGGLESTRSPHVTQSLCPLCIPSDNCDTAPLSEYCWEEVPYMLRQEHIFTSKTFPHGTHHFGVWIYHYEGYFASFCIWEMWVSILVLKHHFSSIS